MSERKAREFWIAKGNVLDTCLDAHVYSEHPAWATDFIHVREVLPDDELERLRAENADLKASIACLLNDDAGMKIENERLKAKLGAFKVHGTDDCENYDCKEGGRITLFKANEFCISCGGEEYTEKHLLDNQTKLTKLREAAAGMRDALVEISLPSHSSLTNKDTEFHNKHAREALARYDDIMKGGE